MQVVHSNMHSKVPCLIAFVLAAFYALLIGSVLYVILTSVQEKRFKIQSKQTTTISAHATTETVMLAWYQP